MSRLLSCSWDKNSCETSVLERTHLLATLAVYIFISSILMSSSIINKVFGPYCLSPSWNVFSELQCSFVISIFREVQCDYSAQCFFVFYSWGYLLLNNSIFFIQEKQEKNPRQEFCHPRPSLPGFPFTCPISHLSFPGSWARKLIPPGPSGYSNSPSQPSHI